MARPITTLFMLMSVDGKISPGITDELDFDKDLPQIPGVGEGLQQYYDIEQTTDLWALNSGRVQAKMGVNEMPLPEKTPVSFVLIDNHHLTEQGIRWSPPTRPTRPIRWKSRTCILPIRTSWI